MKIHRSRFLPAFVLSFSLLVFCAGHAAEPSNVIAANAERVAEVLDGERLEAFASWWGFDPNDSTAYLQRAIDSKVPRLIIDRQSSPWVTGPLSGVSGQEIILQQGVELVALKGAYRPKGDCLLSYRECRDVILRGELKDAGKSARIRMRKQDYQSGDYDRSEWRHALALYDCENVLIQDLTIEQSGGDGIYLGTTAQRRANRNIVIRRVDCNDNHRQGISVISAENLLIEDCRLRNTDGTAPQAGIDFEPNHAEDLLVNCVLRDCIAENNTGTGYQICPQFMSGASRPISIVLENCISRDNKQHAIHLCSAPKDPPSGSLHVKGFLAERDAMAGISVQFNPWDAIRIELEDTTFRDCAAKDNFFPPIYLQGLESEARPTGGIRFTNVIVKDELDRSIFKIVDRTNAGLKELEGEVMLERGGKRSAVRP